MEAGRLVSDDVMIGIVRERLDRPDAETGFVLDGFPRTIVQADALDRMVGSRGPLVVLDIVVPEEVLVRRLASRRICGDCGSNASVDMLTACGKCGGLLIARVDDGVEIVRERLGVYHRQTKPVVDYYLGRPTFRQIDGYLPPDVVTGAIDAALVEAAAVSSSCVVTPGTTIAASCASTSATSRRSRDIAATRPRSAPRSTSRWCTASRRIGRSPRETSSRSTWA